MFRHLPLLASIVLPLLIPAKARAVPEEPEDTSALKKRALAVMQDIVPPAAAMKALAKVSMQNDRALWGRVFGDDQPAALVAIRLHEPKADERLEDADLCLLLWKKPVWQFAQRVGKVSAYIDDHSHTFDWSMQEVPASHTFYLLNRLDFNVNEPLLSWFCNPRSHRLGRTTWPTNRIPSIAGDTITFQGSDKPGRSPTIREIHWFDGTVGPLLARITGEDESHRDRGQLISVPTANHRGWETWRIWDRSKEFQFPRTVYGLACMSGVDIDGAPAAEATAEFSRAYGSGGSYITTLFLEWRLTGLSKEALEGSWDEDARHNFPKPEWVKITGDAEAVRRFSWPPLPNAAKAGPSATPVP